MRREKRELMCLPLAWMLLFGFSVGNVQAGWHKTEWGMTINEVRAALTEPVEEMSEDERQNYRNEYSYKIPDYTIGRFDFKVLFGFSKQQKLQTILIVKKEDHDGYACFLDLEAELKKKYGTPSESEEKEGRFSSMARSREWITQDTIITLNYVMLLFDSKAHETTNISYVCRKGATRDRL